MLLLQEIDQGLDSNKIQLESQVRMSMKISEKRQSNALPGDSSQPEDGCMGVPSWYCHVNLDCKVKVRFLHCNRWWHAP